MALKQSKTRLLDGALTPQALFDGQWACARFFAKGIVTRMGRKKLRLAFGSVSRRRVERGPTKEDSLGDVLFAEGRQLRVFGGWNLLRLLDS